MIDRLPYAVIMAILDSPDTPYVLAAKHGVSLEFIRKVRPGDRWEDHRETWLFI